MLPIPADVLRSYEAALQRKGIDGSRAPHFVRWLRFYLDFCSKYRFASGLVSSVPRFIAKLREKHQEGNRSAPSLYFTSESPLERRQS